MMEIATLTEACNEEQLKEAAEAMVAAHNKHAAMIPAILEVRETSPKVSNDVLASLWLGIEAKSKDKGTVALRLARSTNF
ncbi:hypothetical protein [Vibrio parahaemolyticus]|uniref:hypothetical protein n=1 Tax=Vibrio parahaemolyticus TaxID=670 RepID=UPI0023EC2E65|nr:hypothetical protein [Vibrio parahaemolyticus]